MSETETVKNRNELFHPEKDVHVVKKDGTRDPFRVEKVLQAVSKSAARVMVEFTEEEKDDICRYVVEKVNESGYVRIPIAQMHFAVEYALEKVNPKVAESYRNYRNYKQDFVHMLDDVYQKSQSIMYIGDKENANTDSALVSTRRSLVYNELNRELYRKFFLTQDEIDAAKEGYIYIHDMAARRDTFNCCLFDIQAVLEGGFEMGSVWYNQPRTLDTVFDVCGDIILSAASQQYGGFTIPEVDKMLAPYARCSFDRYLAKYRALGLPEEAVQEQAMKDLSKEMEQGFQGWEYKFNTVASSRGDYPFITVTAGLGTDPLEKLATRTLLRVRKGGQGKKGHKKPVLFPKVVFLYDEKLHGKGGPSEDLFEEGVACSAKAMYPDWLSLSGEGYVAGIYQKYGRVVSPMGCRAFLSPWYERGGETPADEEDKPVFVGRFNIGVVSLHLPMILAKAREEEKDFFEVLDYYLELIRGIHQRTYDYLGNMKAGGNPLAFCEGGLYGGHLGFHDKIEPLLKPATASFGITALNELQILYNGKSLVEDGEFALETMRHIQAVVDRFKKEDHHLYAIYGTPAENLCGLQVTQFRERFGIIPGVSDRGYVSNSFHCHVSEKISPIQKQDLEARFWDYFNGGKIQYVRYPLDYNLESIRTLVRRAMKMGFYEGVNLSLSYCDDCGHEELGMEVCPVCGSSNLTKIDRMNGYLAYSRVHGDSRLSDAKMEEIGDRLSM